MKMDLTWFHTGPLPGNMVGGSYDIKLVVLSYLIAVLASYVALDFVGRLRAEKSPQYKTYWIAGGAFAMGAGIWSMHFIGMLAFVMPMPMSYEMLWTIGSMLVAIAASAFALYILKDQKRPFADVAKGGVLIGLAIATMHYMGMEGMKTHINIQYLPGLFTLSILIAVFASEAALWLTIESTKKTGKEQFLFKIGSALVMGVAICGMHYTGMAAAIFTPLGNMTMDHSTSIHPTLMALFIAGFTSLIIGLALTVSTYYRKMLNAIQNEKEFLNAMLDNLDDGIIACDANGIITVFNHALQKFVGESVKTSDIQQFDYFEFYELNKDEPLTIDNTPLCKALQGERIHGKEFLLKFRNGVTRNVVIDGQPIMREDGYALGAVIAIHDITELKQTEKIKSEFVSVVSHELRTPLTSILGSLGLIMGGTVGDFSDKAKKLLDIANKNCERLLLLINDILDMEKIESGKMVFDLQAVQLDALIHEAIITNKAYGEKYGIDIQMKESIPDLYVQADPHRLMQVLANLISNAVKFSKQNGQVTVTMSRHNAQVRVSIIDQGSGIPLDFQPRIFQKFSQADSSTTRGKSGTGLGLSISKIIIDKLGGTIGFLSKQGEGATFYFDLPIISQPQAESVEKVPVSLTDKRFLICEDDYDQAKYLSVLMEASGWQSDIAGTVNEARVLLEKHNYEAILLDLILPDQDGITFIRELRESPKTRDLPIIVLSIIAETGQAIINGDALSVIDWLEKPINFGKLMQAISRIQHPKANQLPVVLHIEDDLDTQKIMQEVLGNTVSLIAVDTIKKAKMQLLQSKIDAVILDLLLPDGNGSTLLPLLAQRQIPVIVYSATELDKDFSRYVIDALVKSKITNNELLTKIKNLFPAPPMKEEKYAKQNP